MDTSELQRVSRSDLLRSSQSPPSSPTLTSLPFSFEYEFIAPAPPAAAPPPDSSEAEDEIAFSLFSSRPATKLTLRSPTPEVDPYELAAKTQRRPKGYYFHGGLAGEELGVAVSGESVRNLGGVRFWNADRKPWKVIDVKAFLSPKLLEDVTAQRAAVRAIAEAEGSKRKKPGKKRRLQLRVAERKMKEEEEARLRAEEHKKEKARRLNQARKGKRREKAKLAKKAAVGGGMEGVAIASATPGPEKKDPDAMEE